MTRRLIPFTLLALLVSATSVQAQADKPTIFGVKAGVVGPGCVYVDDSDCFDSSVSYSLGGFVDTRLGEKLLGGIALDLHNGSSADSDFEELIYDLSLNLKADLGETTTFRPGFGLGYARSDVEGETLQAMTVRALLEVILPSSGQGPNWLGEVALYASPAGGTECCDVTWGPGFYLRGGVVF